MLKIIQAPNQVLATATKPLTKFDKNLVTLITQMQETLEAARDPEGVGLAAPQVDKSYRLFIAKESKDDPLMVFINPKILKATQIDLSVVEEKPSKKIRKSAAKVKEGDEKQEKVEVKLEGCLSLQDVWGIVHRSDTVTISYQDETGTHHTKTFDGFMATIIQHEIDHLEGILFPRRVLEQNGKLYKSFFNKKGEMEFEELTL